MRGSMRFVVPWLALAVLTAACDDRETTGVITTTQAKVRFVNAISDVNGNLALTANNNMVGSSLPFGNSGTTCTTVNSGSTAFAFGAANTGGTGISSSLSTFTQTLASGRSYTIVATGTSANPQYVFIDNTAASAATTGNVNVRFVNATGTSNIDAFATASGSALGDATVSGLGSAAASTYTMVPVASSTLTFRAAGSTTPIFTTTTGSFTSGGNYTVVLMPGPGGVGFQTLVLNASC